MIGASPVSGFTALASARSGLSTIDGQTVANDEGPRAAAALAAPSRLAGSGALNPCGMAETGLVDLEPPQQDALAQAPHTTRESGACVAPARPRPKSNTARTAADPGGKARPACTGHADAPGVRTR
jgi:hypothetical protein